MSRAISRPTALTKRKCGASRPALAEPFGKILSHVEEKTEFLRCFERQFAAVHSKASACLGQLFPLLASSSMTRKLTWMNLNSYVLQTPDLLQSGSIPATSINGSGKALLIVGWRLVLKSPIVSLRIVFLIVFFTFRRKRLGLVHWTMPWDVLLARATRKELSKSSLPGISTCGPREAQHWSLRYRDNKCVIIQLCSV